MAARAGRLGDRGPSAPEHWESGLGTGEAHVLVTVYGDRRRSGSSDARASAQRRRREPARSTLVHEQRARRCSSGARPLRLLRRHRPAGGRGQRRRAAARRRPARRPRRLARRARPASSCSATRTRTARCPTRPPRRSTATARSSSTASCAMDVAAFRRFVGERRAIRAAPEQLAAKIVGRWRDGTPLARLAGPPGRRASPPTRRRSTTSATPTTRDGLRCPLGAHIRRANPRDARRLLRRPALQPPPHHPPRPHLRRSRSPHGAIEDDGVDRGLVFVCFNAEHLAPVRDDPGTLDRRRRPVRPRPRQGLPDRRAARHAGQDDDPGTAARSSSSRSRAS